MRVLQLIDTLEAGGAERMAVNIANGLAEFNIPSYLCATRAEGLLKNALQEKVSYLFLNRKHTLDGKAIYTLVNFVKQEHITIIHAHASSFFIATLVKLCCSHIKLVWHDHYGNSQFLTTRPKRVLQWCSRSFSATIAVNTQLKEWNISKLKSAEVHYIPNFSVYEKQIRQTALKGLKGYRIVHLANLRPQKGHVNLLKAFQQVVNENPKWTLHCVGKDFKDDYAQSVKDEVLALGLSENVYFYGSCPDTLAILEQTDIGVLASDSEGLPLALLEYGLTGLPIVATDVGDCNKVIKNAGTGRLVPAADANRLADALLELINNNKLRVTTGAALQAYVQKHYSKKSCLEHIITVYKSLL